MDVLYVTDCASHEKVMIDRISGEGFEGAVVSTEGTTITYVQCNPGTSALTLPPLPEAAAQVKYYIAGLKAGAYRVDAAAQETLGEQLTAQEPLMLINAGNTGMTIHRLP